MSMQLFAALAVVSIIISTLACAASMVAIALWYGTRLSTHKIQYMPAESPMPASEFLRDPMPEEEVLDPFAGFPKAPAEQPFLSPMARVRKYEPNPEELIPDSDY